MTASDLIKIIVILVLLFFSAFFSSAETALTTVPAARLRCMLDDGVRNAAVLEKVLSRKDKMLSVILICNNIVNLVASAIATIVVQNLFGSAFVSLGTGILTLLVLIFGEISPKTMATYKAEKLALSVAPIINVLMIVFTPIAAAINFLASGVLRLMGINKNLKAASYTENEIRSIVEVGEEEGVIEQKEKEIINNVFDFNDTIAREVMVPRIDVTSIDADATYEEVREIFRENYYTRFPVYDSNKGGYIGVINVKDLILFDPVKDGDFSARKMMRELGYTFEQKRLSDLFKEMKSARAGIMAVMDEYGDTVGIVTMEDLVEEIVGDIRDEYDDAEGEEIKKTGEKTFCVPGHMAIADVNESMGLELESEECDSVGGLVMEKLGRLPAEGDKVVCDNVTLVTKKMDGAKIGEIEIRING